MALSLAAVSAVAVTAAVAAPQVAHAQAKKPPPPAKDPKLAEAKKLFDQGSEAYADGKYEDAVKAWEKSYELSGKPLIFESIGNAYERMGDHKKAREYLSKWRAEAPEAEHEQLDARIKNLDSRIAAAEKAAAEKSDEALRKKAEREAAEKAAKEEIKAKQKARSQRLTIGLAVAGVGVLAVGAGVVMDVIASGQRPDPSTACSAGDKPLCKESARGAIEGSSTLALAGDITWIAGAVIAAGGGVLLITLPASPQGAVKDPLTEAPKEPAKQGSSPRRWVSIAPVVTESGGGISVSGSF